jgi:hypothetical protein
MLGLDLNPTVDTALAGAPAMSEQVSPPEAADSPALPAPSAREDVSREFAVVMGRPQVASLAFLAITLMAVVSSAAYVVGRKTGAAPVLTEPTPAVAQPAAEPARVSPPAAPRWAAVAAEEARPETPIHGNPVPGEVYWQVGALERGYAAMVVQGLRSQGIQAMMADGPSSRIFRVLVGPVRGSEETALMREQLEQYGLSMFLRKFSMEAERARHEPALPTPPGAVTTAANRASAAAVLPH